jgi:hypothetical protein
MFLNDVPAELICPERKDLTVVWASRFEMSGVFYNGSLFRLFVLLVCFILGMIPGMWATWRGLKALAYYMKLKIVGEDVVY